MARYEITSKSGKRYEIEATDGADEQSVMAEAERLVAQQESGGEPDVSTGERALRSVNRALTLGFYDNIVAHGRTIAGQRDPGQSYGEAYRANLERERSRSKASEIKSIDDVVPIAGETAGNVVTGLAMLPRKAAQTTGQALQWTLEQMAPQMTRTQVAKEGAKVGGAWGAAGGLGNTDGDVVEQLQGMGAGTAGGVLLGAGLPTAMGMVGDVMSGAQGLVNKKRAAMGEAAATKAREFEEAGVPVFSPAISNSQTVQSTAEGLSGTVSGSALRQKARVSIEAVEDRAKAILDQIGATRPASDVGAEVQGDLRKALVERSKPKSEVDAMDPAALQDQTGMRPGFNWDPKPPKVQPTQPAPVKPVSPDEYLRQVADDVAPVPPRPVEEVRPNRIPDAKPRPPSPVEPDVDLPPEINQRFFKASDDVAAAAREFNSTRAAIVETLDAFRDRAKALGLTLHDSPMFGPPKIVDRFGHDYRTSREMSNDARSLATTLDDWVTGTMPGLEKNLQALQARHEEASRAFAAAQTERQMATYRAANERQLAAEQAAREETAAARRAEAERVARANAEARAAEDARVARETEEFRRQVVERERPRAEEMAAQRTKEAEWRAYAEAERDTRQRQAASDDEFAAEVRQRRQGPVVPDNINAQTRESYPTTFDMAYRQADLNTPTIQRNPLGSDTIPGWKNTETTKVLQSIADEAAAVGRVRRGPILDENGRVRADVLDEIGRLGGADVRGIVARLSELRPGGAAQPRVQSIDLMKREVGRALGEARSRGDWPAGTHKPDDAFLSRLYDALAKDTDAILGTQVSGNAAIAREQRRALSDQYKEYLNDLRIPLAKVFGPEVTPAQAVDRLTMAARSRTKVKSGDGATNDIKLLTSAYRVAREKGDEDRVTAAILTRLADGGMEGFLSGYRALSPEAKFVMAQSPRTKQLMTQLEGLAKVGGYLERYAASARGGEGADLSRLMTTPNVMTGLLAMLHLPSAISAVVGGEVASRILASPKFGNWLQRVPKEAARGLMSPEWQRHILRLRGYAVEQMGLPQETWNAVVETLSPSKAHAVFLGEKSKTADRAALASAKEMASQGATREEILEKTGWFQERDGSWWYETDDSGVGQPNLKKGRVGSALNVQSVTDAYPSLAKVPFTTKGVAEDEDGHMLRRGNTPLGIALNRHALPPVQRKSGLHEIQHAVDTVEGRADDWSDDKDWATSPLERRAYNTGARADMTAEQRRATPPWATEEAAIAPAREILAKMGIPETPKGVWLPQDAARQSAVHPPGMMKLGGPMPIDRPASNIQRVLFAGDKSASADKASRAEAEEMARAGASRDEIWSATGWWQAPHDGKWRYEIDDSGAKANKGVVDALGKAKNGDVVAARRQGRGFVGGDAPGILSHEEFYKAYPGARRAGGGDGRSLGVIVTKGNRVEGFAKPAAEHVSEDERSGSVYKKGTPEYEQLLILHKAQPNTFPHPDDVKDAYGKEQYIEIMLPNGQKLVNVTLHELQHYIQNVEGFGTGTSPEAAGGFDKYQEQPGEMEARVVEWRQHMTAEERRRTPPWVTWQQVADQMKRNPGRRPEPPPRR